ncbi:MAG: hypothetical protein ACI4VH_05135 [Clostridia bacterium]
MNKEKVIKELEKVTGLDNGKCVIVNSILENHFIIGKKNKEKMILDMEEQLKITKEDAERIYESAMSILANGIKDKLKHPFGTQE